MYEVIEPDNNVINGLYRRLIAIVDALGMGSPVFIQKGSRLRVSMRGPSQPGYPKGAVSSLLRRRRRSGATNGLCSLPDMLWMAVLVVTPLLSVAESRRGTPYLLLL